MHVSLSPTGALLRSRGFSHVVRVGLLALASVCAACVDREAPPPLPPDAGVQVDAGSPASEDAGTPPRTFDGGTRRDGGGIFTPSDDGGADGGPIVLPPEIILVEVRTCEPRRGPMAGGTPIVIVGRGFVPGTVVTIGGAPLANPVISAERRITGRTPAGVGGTAAIVIENRAGQTQVPGGFTYEEAPRIEVLTPAVGPTSGGTELEVTGEGFAPDSAVYVGARAALDVRVLDVTRLRVVTPGGEAGTATVSVINRGGVATRDGAFTYGDAPRIDTIAPAFGSAAGGTVVQLDGAGLGEDVSFFIGGVAARRLEAAGNRARFETPPAPRPGPVDIVALTQFGAARSPQSFTYTQATPSPTLALDGVVPNRGGTGGGEAVRVLGSGFDLGVAAVHFGDNAASDVVVESPTTLRVTTPAGVAGDVTVSVRGSSGATASRPAGFLYADALRIDALSPDRGPASGNTLVTVRGSGFTADARVYFGPLPAATTFIDGATLLVRTPNAAGGAVDVTVRAGERSVTRPNGFLFEEAPRVFRVTPGRGAIAGGTYVRVAGAGFTAETRLFFNGQAARDIRYVHPGLMTARAPSGFVGTADVIAGSSAGATQLDAAYEYFDPASRYSGTSGGPIDGALNVTVLNGSNGRPVPGAIATLSVNGATSLYEGFTDARGQVVLSGANLLGRQTLTVTKETYSAASIVRFDAQNVTLYISPLTGSFGPGPGGGVEPPTIRGTLRSAFKPIPPPPPGFKQAIIVTLSAEAYWLADYIPQDSIQILFNTGIEDRPYEIKGRHGDQAVYALGGHMSDSGERFIPYVMGIKRYISIRPDERLVDGKDININADLPATLDARFLGAPPLTSAGPHVYRMRVYLDLGSDGVLTFFQLPESTTEPRLQHAHLPVLAGATAGASYLVIAGAYTLTSGYETLPLSELAEERVTDISQPLNVGPLMSIAGAARPLAGEVLSDFHFGWRYDAPPEASFFQLYLPHKVGDYAGASWSVIVPGDAREAFVPDLQSLLGTGGIPRASTLDWYILATRVRRFDIDAYDSRDLRDRLGYSFIRHSFETP